MVEFLNTVREALVEIQRNRTSEKESLRYHLMHLRDVLERWKIAGLNRKLQMKPRKFEEYIDETTGQSRTRCTEVQLILKWVCPGSKDSTENGKNLTFCFVVYHFSIY
jgi:hypothetical protein